MRVLLLTQFYWPEERSAPKNLAGVAEFLQRRGHEMTVITGFPNHPLGRLYEGYRMRWRQFEEVRGVRVLRVPLYPNHSLSLLRRGWNYTSFALSAASLGAWLTRRFAPDVLLVYLPPLTNWLPVRVLQSIHRVPVVYWETDLWPDALVATGNPPHPWIHVGLERLDRAVHRRAAKICLNSPGLASRLKEKGVDPNRLEVVTDWADESLFFPVEPDPHLAAEYGFEGKFNVVFGGSFGPAQDLASVVETAARLTDLEDLQFVFIGGGEEEASLRAKVEEMALENVRFVARQPMAEIHRFYALAEVLLVHLRPEPLFELQIPSKTMAYLACGRPILCAVSGPASRLVRDAGAGLSAPPGDPVGLAETVRRFYEMSPQERSALGKRGRQAYLAKYTREVQATRLESILSEVVGGGGATQRPE